MASFKEYIEDKGYTFNGDPNGPKEGSFARIFKATHNESQSIRAFKVLMKPIIDKKDTDYQSFIREFEVLQQLGDGGNSNIIHVYELHNIDNLSFVEMEFVDGKNLREYLCENKGYVLYDEVLSMVRQISGALAYCHGKGIKHNDIHSANIMRRGERDYVLLDFGLAIKQNESGLTITRKEGGASEYKAPEKWSSKNDPTTQSDIYSFGIVMYELLAGEVPFSKEKFDENALKKKHIEERPKPIYNCRKEHFQNKNGDTPYVKDYPQWLEEVIFQCMEKEPGKRFKDGVELHNCIEQHYIDEATGNGAGGGTKKGPGEGEEERKGNNKKRLILIILFLLGCIGVYYGFIRENEPAKVIIKVESVNDSLGTVKGAGTYSRGDTITIEAIAKEGCKFVVWNDENTDGIRRVVADHNQVYLARFDSIVTMTPIVGSDTIDEVSDTNDNSEVSENPAISPVVPKFMITVASDDPNMGTVKGGGKYDSLAAIKIEAHPKNGYQFVSWNDGNKNRRRTIKVLSNQEYTARFQKIENKPVETYNLEWGNYAGPMKGGKPDGRPGKVTVTRTHDIVDASGNTHTVYPGETITATKFDNGRLKSGEIHRKDGSHLLFMAN